MRFSINKFLSLSKERQLKKSLDFIAEIEKHWEQPELRHMEILNLKELLEIMEDNNANILSRKLSPHLNHREFLQAVVPFEQYHHKDKRDTDIFIHKLDGNRENRQKLDLIIVLSNLRSAFNVGSILRTAECFGISEVFFCGYTPDNSKVTKTAMGTREYIKVSHFEDTASAIDYLRAQNRVIYALETAQNAISVYDEPFSSPAALIVGNEALGISPDILELADKIIQIPLAGWKNSLNVGTATAIAISEIYRKK